MAAAGLEEARSVGVLGPTDLENLGAALLVADHVPDTRIVVRIFSPELGVGVQTMLGKQGVALSEVELAGPLLVQAALSGNSGQRITIAGRVLQVAEVDRDDPAMVVALCDADDPSEILPPRERLTHRALALVDPSSVVSGARGALPSAVARHHAPRKRRRIRVPGSCAPSPRRAYILLGIIVAVFAVSATVFGLGRHLEPSTPCTSPRRRWRRSATATSASPPRRTG